MHLGCSGIPAEGSGPGGEGALRVQPTSGSQGTQVGNNSRMQGPGTSTWGSGHVGQIWEVMTPPPYNIMVKCTSSRLLSGSNSAFSVLAL